MTSYKLVTNGVPYIPYSEFYSVSLTRSRALLLEELCGPGRNFQEKAEEKNLSPSLALNPKAP